MKKINPANAGYGPRPSKTRDQSGQQIIIDQNEYQISFDVQEFDNFIRSQGVRLVHYKAIPDPTGMTSRGDMYGSSTTRSNSDGMLFYKGGVCQALFTVNNKSYNIQLEGAISLSSAFITLPRFYEDGSEIVVHPYDRFYIQDIETKVTAMQYIESNSTGIDRLQYPAVKVEHLVDANGVKYEQGKQFELTEDGNVKWLTQNRPGWNTTAGKGTVYAIRYLYIPFFVVNSLVHEIRIAQVSNPLTMDRSVQRMPYAVHVLRENVFHDTNRDPNRNINDQRYQEAPPVGGSFGPK